MKKLFCFSCLEPSLSNICFRRNAVWLLSPANFISFLFSVFLEICLNLKPTAGRQTLRIERTTLLACVSRSFFPRKRSHQLSKMSQARSHHVGNPLKAPDGMEYSTKLLCMKLPVPDRFLITKPSESIVTNKAAAQKSIL